MADVFKRVTSRNRSEHNVSIEWFRCAFLGRCLMLHHIKWEWFMNIRRGVAAVLAASAREQCGI